MPTVPAESPSRSHIVLRADTLPAVFSTCTPRRRGKRIQKRRIESVGTKVNRRRPEKRLKRPRITYVVRAPRARLAERRFRAEIAKKMKRFSTLWTEGPRAP
eukprot:6195638-Pleurochrysis_carterae.AAC.1